MVLGLSEVDAHIRRNFDSEDGASAAPHASAHHALSNPNRGEVKYRGGLEFTATAEQLPVEYVHPRVVVRLPTDRNGHEIRIEISSSDTHGLNDFAGSCQDVVDLNDDRTAAFHHTKGYTPHGFPLTQRRRGRTLQRASKPKNLFPPPRGSSLSGHSLRPGPHASSSIAARVVNSSHPPSVGFPADSDERHTRIPNMSHKSDSKCGGCKSVSKAVRHLGVCFWSNACTTTRRPSGNVPPSQ